MKGKVKVIPAALFLILGGVRSMSWAAETDQGRMYFLRYCGSCHGVDGKGDGTVSRSLKVKPADLTQLKNKNKGVFPLDKVMATINGKTRVEAHDMGDRFPCPVHSDQITGVELA